MKKVSNQHGDVVLTKVASIPVDAKKITVEKTKPFVVEKGEGVHTHVIHDIGNVEVFVNDEAMYLNVLKDLKIDHEEHGAQMITTGLYRKDIERQFDYENKIERGVTD